MKRMGIVAMTLVAMVTVSAAQEKAKEAARDAGQATKATAQKSGNAIKDGWITMKVHSQFIPEDALSNSDIDVDTKNGVVTLNGTVAGEAGKARAVAIAKATDGVKSVTDNLKIAARDAAPGTAGTAGRAMSDGWIKSKIAAQFVTEDSLDNSDIDIDVSKGAVVLHGAVRTPAAKNRAADIAKATDGVKGVTNNLKVDSSVK